MTHRSDAGDGHDVGGEDDQSSEHLSGDASPAEGVLVLVHQPRDDALEAAHGAVHPQHDQHEEEDHGPELRAGQRGHRLRVHLEHEPGALQPIRGEHSGVLANHSPPGPPRPRCPCSGSAPCSRGR